MKTIGPTTGPGNGSDTVQIYNSIAGGGIKRSVCFGCQNSWRGGLSHDTSARPTSSPGGPSHGCTRFVRVMCETGNGGRRPKLGKWLRKTLYVLYWRSYKCCATEMSESNVSKKDRLSRKAEDDPNIPRVTPRTRLTVLQTIFISYTGRPVEN